MLRKKPVLLWVFLAVWVCAAAGNGVLAAQSPQVPLDPTTISKFAQPLPLLSLSPFADLPFPADEPYSKTINTVLGNQPLTLRMCEFDANVLPPGTITPGVWTHTKVWGYIVDTGAGCPTTPQDTYTGPVIVNQRGGGSTDITYINDLGTTATTQLKFWNYSVDQTLDWADPLNNEANNCHNGTIPASGSPCASNYEGPIPAVPHIHGGEVPPELDGGPDAWFTSDGAFIGHGYYSFAGAPGNGAIYKYPNTQEAGPVWFHDHLLGGTRLNVYAGLAGVYYMEDPTFDTYLNSINMPSLPEVVPLVIQDRMFDQDGQLFFPGDSANSTLYSPNPEHPYWVPEFIGDTILVNGKAWPYLDVRAKRYRFLILNGSNARSYLLRLNKIPLYVIGTDGGYLDAPVSVDSLLIMPGERYEVIIDFAGKGSAIGTRRVLKNTARAPYPGGDLAKGTPVEEIMEFRVYRTPAGFVDSSYDPAVGTPLRTGAQMIPRLADPVAGTLAAGITPVKTRQLTLNEVLLGPLTYTNPVTGAVDSYAGGPSEILVNNTTYSGKSSRTYGDYVPLTLPGFVNSETWYYETPQEGDTEEWEIVNLTADAHPIHLHLVQFQIVNRQTFHVGKYNRAYEAAFPPAVGNPLYRAGGVFIPGFGPPLDYNPSIASGMKYGGNPDVTPFLIYRTGGVWQPTVPVPPGPQEAGWKDTVVALPNMVTRIVVRWAPTSLPTTALASELFFPFDPLGNTHHGYVWHCHIIDHEDNEMMRPLMVDLNPSAPAPGARPLQRGTDY